MDSDSSMQDPFKPTDCSSEKLLHDLQQHQVALEFKLIELEVQNQHLRSLQTQHEESINHHEESESYYADLYNNAPVGYLTLTDKGLISEANLTATKLIGIDRQNLLSRCFASLVTAQDSDRWYLFCRELENHKQQRPITLSLKGYGDTEVSAQLDCLPINSMLRITLNNVTTTKQLMSDALSARVERENSLNEDFCQQNITTEALQRSHDFLKLAITSGQVGIWQYNLQTNELIWDDTMFALYGCNRMDFSGAFNDWSDRLHPDDRAATVAALDDAISSHRNYNPDFRVIWTNGEVHHVKGHAHIVKDKEGKPQYMVGTNWDNNAFAHSQEQLLLARTAINNSNTAFIWLTSEGQVTDANDFACKSLGYSQNELFNLHVWDIDYDLSAESWSDIWVKLKISGQYQSERSLRHKNGTLFPVEVSSDFIEIKGKEYSFSSVKDITERKQFERSLLQSHQDLHSLIKQSPVSIAMFDMNMNYLETSNLWLTEFGQGIKNLVGCNHYEEFPDLPDTWKAIHQQGLAGAFLKNDDDCWVQKDGRKYWLRWAVSPWINREGAIGGIIIHSENITERKQLELSLSEASAFNASILNSLPARIAVLNKNGIIIAVNNAWQQFAQENGLPEAKQNFIGFSYLDACSSFDQHHEHDHFAIAAHQGISALLAGKQKAFYLDYPCHTPERQRWFHLKAVPLKHQLSACVIVSHNDITERKHRELMNLDHLAHVTRLGMMGEMASGLAHEVNQPLAAIATYGQVCLNLMKKENPDLIKLTEVITKTQEQALRAGQIIHRMKRFCSSKSQQRSTVDINELINHCVELCTSFIQQHSILINLELADNLPVIHVDHIQIEQVIINLIRNGIDAIVSVTDRQPGKITIQSYLTHDNKIQVCVEDNGPGIEEDQQLKILMPFHTTKENGMGMGLSISRSLIEAHDGKLSFNSQLGTVTSFYFTLPI